MANEITYSGSLSVAKGNLGTESLGSPSAGLKASLTGKQVIKATQTIPTTAGGTAFNLGALGSVGWALIKNLDPTNYADVMTAVSGTAMIRIPPLGQAGPFMFTPTVTAPAALAHTASVDLEYEFAEI